LLNLKELPIKIEIGTAEKLKKVVVDNFFIFKDIALFLPERYKIDDFIRNYAGNQYQYLDGMIQGFSNFRRKFQELFKIDPLTTNAITIGQISYEIFRGQYYDSTETPLYTVYNEILHKYFSNVRAGRAEVFQRYAWNDDRSVLLYIDCNACYSHAMQQDLPFGIPELELPSQEVEDYFKNLRKGSEEKSENVFKGFLIVDLEYSPEQQERVKDFPPLGEKKRIRTQRGSERKLVFDLCDKYRYFIYGPVLEKLLIHDLVTLRKIHWVIRMESGPVCKKFVDNISGLRQEAENMWRDRGGEENLWQKELCKLVQNSLTGKFNQDDLQFRDFRIVRTPFEFQRVYHRGHITNFTRFNDNLCLLELIPKGKKMYRRVPYLQNAILDLSKWTMIDLYYNVLKKKFPNIELCYTDTDSFIFKVKLDDKETFTTTEAKKNKFFQIIGDELKTKYFAEPGDVTPGKFKIEDVLSRGIFLAPKIYIFERLQGSIKVVQSGSSPSGNDNTLRSYAEILVHGHSEATFTQNQNKIGSDSGIIKQTTTTIEKKLNISQFDQKRKVLGTLEELKIVGSGNDNYCWTVSGTANIYTEPFKETEAEINDFINHAFDNHCARVGIEKNDSNKRTFRETLESCFNSGMSWTGYGINWNNDHLIPVKFYEECKKEGEIVKYRCGLEKQSIEKTIKLSITSKKKIIELFKSWDNLRPLDINENSSKKEILTRETQEYLAKHIKEFQEILRKESEEKFKESEDRRRTKREKIFKIKKLKEEDFLEEVRKVLGKTPEDEIYSMFLRSDTTTNDMPSPLQEEEEEIEVSDEQREIYNQIMNVHCAFLTGPAGTGKTRLLHYIAKKNPGLAKLATTGRAANNILGQTVHSFFCLNEQGHSNLFNMKGRRDYISTHSMIIIDEVSMLPPKILDKIDSLLRIIHNNDKPFGGVKIIVCGDLLQIPPIKADPVFRAGAWKHFKIFELQRNYRQEKKEFQEVLSNIRLREPTDEEIKFLIEKSKKSVKKKDLSFYYMPNEKTNRGTQQKVPW
jgi:hypothetical protein